LALQSALTITVVTGLLALWGGVALSDQPGGGDTITICHATDSDENPYNQESPARTSDAGGHAGHVGPVWHLGLKKDGVSWGDVAVTFDSLVDKVGATVIPFSCSPALADSIDVGGSATCLFTVAGYSPADGTTKTNTLTAVVHEGSAATYENTHNTTTASDTSV